MRAQMYRLNTPTLGILEQDGHKTPITIPSGGMIELTLERIGGKGLAYVHWEGKSVMIFTTDLRERGELVNRAEA